MQAHLAATVLTRRYVDGLFTWRTGQAVSCSSARTSCAQRPLRRRDPPGPARRQPRAHLPRRPPVLRERITDATGLIEDGTAAPAPTGARPPSPDHAPPAATPCPTPRPITSAPPPVAARALG
jgi:hypothetical protein